MPTKHDVAKLAGISPATVSNFYKGKEKTASDTKQRIIEAAKILNYPLSKVDTVKTKTKNTRLVVDDLLNPHYGNILQSL